jgi:ketosteroid isomerase-like protein
MREHDDHGRHLGGVPFDPDDLDAAFAELDARDAAGVGGPFVDGWRLTTAVCAAYNTRDWAAFGAAFTDDFVFVDHQPVGLGTLDREELVTTFRGLIELAPDISARVVAIVRLAATGIACVLRLTGTNETGGPIELERLLVGLIRAGRYARAEFFAIGDFAAACDRLDVLTEPTVGPS